MRVPHQSRSCRRWSHRLGALAFTFAIVCCASVAQAQIITNPHAVTFLASADHNTIGSDGQPIVTRYDLQFDQAGGAQPFLVLNLGKPAPDADGYITVDFWSMLTSPPMPGQVLEAHVAAVGPAGSGDSTASNQFMFTAPDTTAPRSTITTPTSAMTYSTTTTPLPIGGTASDDVGVTQVSWANDRGGSGTATGTTAWTASVALQSGANVITVTAQDAAGNLSVNTLTVTYALADTSVPSVTITTPTSAATYSTSSTPLALGGTASDLVGVTEVSWVNDRGGSGTAAGTTSWIASVALQSGANVITMTARDAAGNTGTDTVTVTYTAPDTTVPTVTITAPTAATTYSTTTTPLALAGTASDNVGVTQVSWTKDGGGSGTATGTTSWTASVPLLSGTNVIRVTARDAAGNTSTAMLTVTYSAPDTAGPSLAITSHSNGQTVTTSSITLAGTASDSGRGDDGITSVTVNGVSATSGTATGSGTASWSLTLTLTSGANTITVVAADGSTGRNTTTQTLAITYSTEDPLLSNQWHLKPRTVEPAGANVFGAWSTTRGAGIVIGIAADGLQWAHPDLLGNYQPALSHDFNDNDADPTPLSSQPLGTAAAGVAAALAGNATGGAGVAPEAQLAGLRLTAAPTSDATLAAAIGYQLDTVHVLANFWGPASDGRTLAGPGALTATAIANAATTGRNGRGRILLWPVGDGRAKSDNCNFNGYANSRFAIAVGAVDDTGMQASYSSACSALLVTAPSSGGSRALTTTDLIGASGYDAGDYTATFGGTSAATAVTSGVTALMLARNPALTWRDVQDILRRSSVRLQPSDPGWTTGSYPHSEAYGFGLVDAQKAVELAGGWSNLPDERSALPVTHTVGRAIPDSNATGISDEIVLGAEYAGFNVEHVEVEFNATHTYRGDLEVSLISPTGVISHLATVRPDDAGHDFTAWRFTTVRHWGESAWGVWTLRVADRGGLGVGTWTDWTLRIYGTGDTGSSPTTPGSSGPQKLAPASGTSGLGSTVTLQWTAVAGAGYAVCWDTTNNNACDGMWFPNGAATWRTLTGLAPGTYYWQVRAQAAGRVVEADGAAWFSFTVDGSTAPSPPTTTTPVPAGAGITKVAVANGMSGLGSTVPLQWTTAAGAGYSVCWDTTNNNACDGMWFPNGAATWRTLTGLAPGTYYWQVRVHTPSGALEADSGTWWSFTVAGSTAPPTGVTTKLAPATGATGLGSSVTLQWAALANAGYSVCWNTTNNNTCTGMWFPNGAATWRTLTGLAPGTYYWQVRAYTPSGVLEADSGTWSSFTVAASPQPK